jgi:hypothetical protein
MGAACLPAVAAVQAGLVVQARLMVLGDEVAVFADAVPPEVEPARASVVAADRFVKLQNWHRYLLRVVVRTLARMADSFRQARRQTPFAKSQPRLYGRGSECP